MDGVQGLTAIETSAEYDAGGMQAESDFRIVIARIENLAWTTLAADELIDVAWAYYYFSVQFGESLQMALQRHPSDRKLSHLATEECDTANLSPWPGVAASGERMNHDEFMRRSLMLATPPAHRARLEAGGIAYLAMTRRLGDAARAMSIASYEDGGLERVFRAMLTAPCWDGPVLRAFAHFLAEHIRFDSDLDAGHGALARHLRPDARVLPLWQGFYDLLVCSVPALLG